MSQQLTTVEFANGEKLTGVIVAEALVVTVLRVNNHFYIVNKLNIKEDAGV